MIRIDLVIIKMPISTPNFVGIPFRTHHCLAIHVVLGLIVQDAEATHSRIGVCVCPVLSSLVSPIFRNDYLVDGPQYVHFELTIPLGCGCQAGRSIDLDEPRFAGIIDKHIESIELEAVFVIDDDTLNTLQGHDDNVIDIFKASICLFSSIDHL
jgi:hypothetical protein